MNGKLIVNVSPHIKCSRTTRGIMLDVILALLPALVAGTVFYGLRALLITAVSVASCVLFEFLYERLLKKPVTVGDLSAVVTGLLFALNVPASIPLWQVVIGAFFAIVITKMLFGGLGCNFMNPALVGRIVLMFSFAAAMNPQGVLMQVGTPDVLTAATPLSAPDALTFSNALPLFLGNYKGAIGETSALAILVGGIYLLVRKVIKPIIPACFVLSTFLFSLLFGMSAEQALMSLLSGGLFLGAFFMATDYVTSPTTNRGKVIFGAFLGLITALIRVFGNLPEGVTFAIILGNILVPYINELTRPVPYGVKERKEAERK